LNFKRTEDRWTFCRQADWRTESGQSDGIRRDKSRSSSS